MASMKNWIENLLLSIKASIELVEKQDSGVSGKFCMCVTMLALLVNGCKETKEN